MNYEQQPLLSLIPYRSTCPLPQDQQEASFHDEEASLLTVRRLKALADPIRLRLMQILAETQGTRCVSELVEMLPRTEPTISRHLHILFDASLLGIQRRGTYSYYYVKPGVLAQVRQMLAAIEEDAQQESNNLS